MVLVRPAMCWQVWAFFYLHKSEAHFRMAPLKSINEGNQEMPLSRNTALPRHQKKEMWNKYPANIQRRNNVVTTSLQRQDTYRLDPGHYISFKTECAPSEDTDQPVHPYSVFAGHFVGS